MIISSDKYCFISNAIQNIDTTPCLGYDWNKNEILSTISIPMIHRIHSQFFLDIMLEMDTMIWTINTQKDIINQTGYTQLNFVKLLLSDSARMANILSVGFHTTTSHNVRNIHNMIRALASERNRISAQIFLFSVLFMLEKNIAKQIRDAMSNQTKCRLKFWGLTSVRNDWNDAGKYDQVSSQNAT